MRAKDTLLSTEVTMAEPRIVRPEDVLSDEENTGMMGGLEVRKGSVAAFIANVRILESLAPTDPGYPEVEAQLRALAPAVRAVGVLDVFAPRSATIAALVGEDRLSGNAAAGS
jgi:hypothetical protein